MRKPVIATALRGIFINSKPWEDAHYIWYDEREKELKENNLETDSVDKWRRLLKENPEKEKQQYFKYVDGVMRLLYSDLSDEERTSKARQLFFDSVCKYIEQNPDIINREVIDYFQSLKDKYILALITTNTQSAFNRILKISGIKRTLFNLIEFSKPKEKDDKKIVFDRFIEKNGKPLLYIGASEEGIKYCKEKNIKCIFANLEGRKDLEDVETIHSVEELDKKLRQLNKFHLSG